MIAGAANGAGLGHDFLRHIERTRLVIHLVDSGAEDPVKDLLVVEKELTDYGHDLIQRPRLLVLNKQELLDQEHQQEVVERLQHVSGRKVMLISAAMSKGLDELKEQVWDKLDIN